jgi:NADH:ubiquinone oxidoreductase subunit 3 (subunit A)
MELVLLSPPFAFVVYLALVGILSGFGRMLAARGVQSEGKHTTYAGGEDSPVPGALPGYRGFFIIALFFAILHLGVLMLGSSNFAPIAGVYLIGLIVALLVLIVG